MKVHWADAAIAAALTAAACTAIYAGLVRALRRAVAERQQATERKLSALETTVKALQLRVVELKSFEAARAQQGAVDAMADATESLDKTAGEENRQIKHETLAAITAAAATFLGRKVHVRSAQPRPASEAGAWAQQGRVIVQTSHNLRPRT